MDTGLHLGVCEVYAEASKDSEHSLFRLLLGVQNEDLNRGKECGYRKRNCCGSRAQLCSQACRARDGAGAFMKPYRRDSSQDTAEQRDHPEKDSEKTCLEHRGAEDAGGAGDCRINDGSSPPFRHC